MDTAVRFARHTHDCLQSLIRFADAKAGALTAYLFLLAGIGYQLVREISPNLRFESPRWQNSVMDYCFVVIWFIFSLAATITVLLLLLRVVMPRFSRHYAQINKDQHLMFWEHILLHSTNQSYYEAVEKMNDTLELRNITDQVYELAYITSEKMAWLSTTRVYLITATASWLLGIAVGYWIRMRGLPDG